MKKQIITTILILLGTATTTFSQDLQTFNEINRMWSQFCESFDSLDAQMFAEVHSKKLIRIPGGHRIMNLEAYIEGYESYFHKTKDEKSTSSLDLRFFERIHNDSIASERGYYKSLKNQGQENERISYGQFHVLLAKENGIWKVLMDYDSNEGKTITEEHFNGAFAMDELDTFIKTTQ